MRLRLSDLLLTLCCLCLVPALPAAAAGHQEAAPADPAAMRAALRQMRKETLAALYKTDPKARVVIRGAAGYAVFESAGSQVLFGGGSQGRGILHDSLTGKETFMRMGAVRAGLGARFEDLRTVLVFKKRESLQRFLDQGWTFGSDRDVEGTAGIVIYQLTHSGVMDSEGVAGTRYWKDKELN
jgi:lipid-binding SYLF domain-containing protein